MSDEIKKTIDNMSYTAMLQKWRFAPSGDTMFQGDIGDYFSKVMFEKKSKVDHVQVSKNIGWD